MRKSGPLSHYYPWSGVPDKLILPILAEFAANGAHRLVLTHYWMERMITERRFASTVDKLTRSMNIQLTDVHGLCGECFDLNCAESARRAGLIRDHELAMQISRDFGAQLYVVHIGAWDVFYRPEVTLQQMRDRADESLEKLVTIADKLGIMLAVENAFELSNSPDEVVRLMKKFAHPALGACFDSGHANFMLPLPDGSCKKYSEHQIQAWRGKPIPEPHPLDKMLPYIVTCHLHDNSGYGDEHQLPGQGTLDWPRLMAKLKQAPRLISFQSEVKSTAQNVSIRELCETMNQIMNL